MSEKSAFDVANTQLDWYRTRKTRARVSHYTLELAVLTLSVLVTVAGILKADPRVPAITGAVLVLLAGLRSLFQFRENWIARAAAEAAVEQELDYYAMRIEPYDGPDRDRVLVRRVWEVRKSETEAWKLRKSVSQPTQEPSAPSGREAADGPAPPPNTGE